MAAARLLLRPTYGPGSRNLFCVVRSPKSSPFHRRCAFTPISRHLSTTNTLAGSSTPQKPSTVTSIASSPKPEILDEVNAPLTTLPTSLELPPRPSGGFNFSYLLDSGKVYFRFFKTGLVNVYHNYKATRPLEQRANAANGSLMELARAEQITRSEFQHLMRTRHDVHRLPVFGLIFLIFAELSPFIIPFVPSAVPWTCRIPQQLERQRRKRKERKDASWKEILKMPLEQRLQATKKELKELSSKEVWHITKVLGIEPRVLPFGFYARKRANKQTEYIEVDDILVQRGGGYRLLNPGEELVKAVEERGMEVTGLSEGELRDKLALYQRLRARDGEVKPGWWLLTEKEWHDVLEERQKTMQKRLEQSAKKVAVRKK